VDPDPGGPKTYGSGGSGFGSGTLILGKGNILTRKLNILNKSKYRKIFKCKILWSRCTGFINE
jgi:hypothetical protein